MKRFDYIIMAGDFEKTGHVFKEDIFEVYEAIGEIVKTYAKAKEVKVEIIESKEEENGE